jgi:neutral ceramidase
MNPKGFMFTLIFFISIIITGFQTIVPMELKVGVAKEDISPGESIMLVGYAARTETSRGIAQPIYAKAIAFENTNGSISVLVTTDLIGLFRHISQDIATQVEKKLNIPRNNLMFTSSHTHTAPLLEGTNLQMYNLTDAQSNEVSKYTKSLKQKIVGVIQKAVMDLTPARLYFGTGNANFAVNRRVFTEDRVRIGVNPDGPVNHRVPVLLVSDTTGNYKAVLFGYACHGTTLGRDDYLQVCGDYMGYACEYLERTLPGITALFVAGCGGDQNPYPRGTLKEARLHGLQLAGTVADVIRLTRESLEGPIQCLFTTVDLPFAEIPTEDEFRERMNSDDPHIKRNALHFLNLLEQGDKIEPTYPYPIQLWNFGKKLTMISLGGEVVVDYALRLERELPVHHLWTIAYANDVCGYVGSARILYEGGYEADQSTIYYSLPSRWDYSVEEKIVSTVKEMVKESEL